MGLAGRHISSFLWRKPALLGLSGARFGDPPRPAAVPKRAPERPTGPKVRVPKGVPRGHP
eukprot:3610294-Pyramimonas_sp.AAC.1